MIRRDTNSDDANRRVAFRGLLFAGLCEAACIIAGVLAFVVTGSWMWIVIGVVASLGFSVPAIIRFFRDVKERDRASR